MVKSRFNPETEMVEVNVQGIIPTYCFEVAMLIREAQKKIAKELGWEKTSAYMKHIVRMSEMDYHDARFMYDRLMLGYLKDRVEGD